MAGLLSHDNDAESKFGNRHSMPVNTDRPRTRVDDQVRNERSKSGKR